MGKPSSKDIGKRAIYNYHVNDSLINEKVSMDIVKNWYPQNFHQKEIFILNKMKELCDGLDGVDIRMTQQTLPLLFMTEEWTETKDGRYRHDKSQILKRAQNRFDDFEHRGYITGNYGCLQFTFSGMEKLEEYVEIKPDVNEKIQQIIDELERNTDESIERYDKLINILQDIKSEPKRFSEYISDLGNIASIAGTIPTIVPRVGGLLSNLVRILD